MKTPLDPRALVEDLFSIRDDVTRLSRVLDLAMMAPAVRRSGASAGDLSKAARATKAPLPPSYAAFLASTNGLQLPGETLQVFASTNDFVSGADRAQLQLIAQRTKAQLTGTAIAWNPFSNAVLILEERAATNGERGVQYRNGSETKKYRSFSAYLESWRDELVKVRRRLIKESALSQPELEKIFAKGPVAKREKSLQLEPPTKQLEKLGDAFRRARRATEAKQIEVWLSMSTLVPGDGVEAFLESEAQKGSSARRGALVDAFRDMGFKDGAAKLHRAFEALSKSKRDADDEVSQREIAKFEDWYYAQEQKLDEVASAHFLRRFDPKQKRVPPNESKSPLRRLADDEGIASAARAAGEFVLGLSVDQQKASPAREHVLYAYLLVGEPEFCLNLDGLFFLSGWRSPGKKAVAALKAIQAAAAAQLMAEATGIAAKLKRGNAKAFASVHRGFKAERNKTLLALGEYALAHEQTIFAKRRGRS